MSTSVIFTLIGIGWLACGIIAYSLTFHFFETEYPGLAHTPGDWKFAAQMGIFGPIGLLTALICCRPYGLRWQHSCTRSIQEHVRSGNEFTSRCEKALGIARPKERFYGS